MNCLGEKRSEADMFLSIFSSLLCDENMDRNISASDLLRNLQYGSEIV